MTTPTRGSPIRSCWLPSDPCARVFDLAVVLGGGQYRGGDGVVRRLEFLRRLEVSPFTQRRGPAPYGVAGGRQPGLFGPQYASTARRHDACWRKPTAPQFSVERDVLVIESARRRRLGHAVTRRKTRRCREQLRAPRRQSLLAPLAANSRSRGLAAGTPSAREMLTESDLRARIPPRLPRAVWNINCLSKETPKHAPPIARQRDCQIRPCRLHARRTSLVVMAIIVAAHLIVAAANTARSSNEEPPAPITAGKWLLATLNFQKLYGYSPSRTLESSTVNGNPLLNATGASKAASFSGGFRVTLARLPSLRRRGGLQGHRLCPFQWLHALARQQQRLRARSADRRCSCARRRTTCFHRQQPPPGHPANPLISALGSSTTHSPNTGGNGSFFCNSQLTPGSFTDGLKQDADKTAEASSIYIGCDGHHLHRCRCPRCRSRRCCLSTGRQHHAANRLADLLHHHAQQTRSEFAAEPSAIPVGAAAAVIGRVHHGVHANTAVPLHGFQRTTTTSTETTSTKAASRCPRSARIRWSRGSYYGQRRERHLHGRLGAFRGELVD